MKKLQPKQWLVAAIWWAKRKCTDVFWRMYHRFSFPQKFKSIGKAVVFRGAVEVEHPFSDIVIGDHSLIAKRCYFLANGQGAIRIGKQVLINSNCFITSMYGITIGNDVSIGENVSIRDYNHTFENTEIPINQQGFWGAPIHIGDDVWIGRGVMITSGVSIGKGCVIGANSVVTSDLQPYSIAVGSPAKVIKMRNEPMPSQP